VRVHNARPVQRGVCQSILGRDCQNEGAGFLPKIEGVVFHRKYQRVGRGSRKKNFVIGVSCFLLYLVVNKYLRIQSYTECLNLDVDFEVATRAS
jgi:hypothetical protein